MGLWCWVKCQSCRKAALIVQLRDHQSSPGQCIVTVRVLTCFINQSYWLARCYFYSQWHDLPARGLISWWTCIDLMLWGREQSGEPTIISPGHTHTWFHCSYPHMFQYSGIIFPVSCLFVEAWLLNSDIPLSPVFSPTLICQQAVLLLQSRGIRAKARCLPSVHSIMLPIRRDIFISSGRDVRPDWADSCALMERDNRLSGVRSHSHYPAIHFHQACQEADGIFSIGLPHIICSKYEGCHQNVTGGRLSGCTDAFLEKPRQQTPTNVSVKQYFILWDLLLAQKCHFATLYAFFIYLSIWGHGANVSH